MPLSLVRIPFEAWTVSTFVLYFAACRQGTRAAPVPVREVLQNFCVEKGAETAKKMRNDHFHSCFVHLDIIKVLFIHQLMHK
jgi:hypothetical protein